MEEICKECPCVHECLELKYANDSQEEYGAYLAKVDYCEELKRTNNARKHMRAFSNANRI